MMFRPLFSLFLLSISAMPLQAATPRLIDPEEERVRLVERMERSVVLVRVTAGEPIRRGAEGVVDDRSAIASGVLLTPDGIIVTAAHAVSDASAITVRFRSGESRGAEVIFVDGSMDIALIRVPAVPPGIEPATLGDSDAVRKGQTVYVIGNPVGVEFSLSTGIVSGRHKLTHVFGVGGELEVIQTDAAMNAGNSGGPMFNSRGEVVAIAQSILSRSGGSEGLGFGLAVNTVKEILRLDPCLYLGFSAVPLAGDLAAAFNVGADTGLLVQFVVPGSPAERAGLREGRIVIGSGPERVLLGGDVITHVDGIPVDDWRREPFTNAREGELHEITFRVVRRGEIVELKTETVHRAHW